LAPAGAVHSADIPSMRLQSLLHFHDIGSYIPAVLTNTARQHIASRISP